MKTGFFARSALAAILVLGAAGPQVSAGEVGDDRKVKLKAIEGTVRLPMTASETSGQAEASPEAPAAPPIGVNEPGINAPAMKIDSGMPQRNSAKAGLPRQTQGVDFGRRTGASRSPAGKTSGPAPEAHPQQGKDGDKTERGGQGD